MLLFLYLQAYLLTITKLPNMKFVFTGLCLLLAGASFALGNNDTTFRYYHKFNAFQDGYQPLGLSADTLVSDMQALMIDFDRGERCDYHKLPIEVVQFDRVVDSVTFVYGEIVLKFSGDSNLLSAYIRVIPLGVAFDDYQFSDADSTSVILVDLLNVEGEDVVVLEYRNVGLCHDKTEESYVNFQVWMYSSSQRMEIRFGDINYHGGMSGFESCFLDRNWIQTGFQRVCKTQSCNNIDVSTLCGDPQFPDAIIGLEDCSFNSMPTSGQVYQFVNVNDTIVRYTGVVDEVYESLKVYPNPSSGVFKVEVGVYTEGVVKVFNVFGVELKTIVIKEGMKTVDVDMSREVKGVYVFKVITENHRNVSEIKVLKL